MKGGGTQTLQLHSMQGLTTVDPSKLTVLQELPEVGKVVIQEARSMGDPISSILEEMKTGTQFLRFFSRPFFVLKKFQGAEGLGILM